MAQRNIDEGNESWASYRRVVVDNLKQANDGIAEVKATLSLLQAQQSDIKSELAALKVKASLWGFMAGAIPGIAATLYAMLRRP